MPFKKIETGPHKGKYKSPSGKIMTYEQVQYYYANNPKTKKKKYLNPEDNKDEKENK